MCFPSKEMYRYSLYIGQEWYLLLDVHCDVICWALWPTLITTLSNPYKYRNHIDFYHCVWWRSLVWVMWWYICLSVFDLSSTATNIYITLSDVLSPSLYLFIVSHNIIIIMNIYMDMYMHMYVCAILSNLCLISISSRWFVFLFFRLLDIIIIASHWITMCGIYIYIYIYREREYVVVVVVRCIPLRELKWYTFEHVRVYIYIYIYRFMLVVMPFFM